MKKNGEIESLFSQKAATWNEKYSVDGPLRYRLGAFENQLRELVAPPAKVLDFGCGTGNLAAHLDACGFALSACDMSAKMIQRAKESNPVAAVNWFELPADWRELPFASDSFDAVVASSVFEYLNDVDATLLELRRVLKPGRFLIATVPNPRKPIRRLERLIRPAVTRMASVPILNRIPKVRSYAAYLACSRNRMPLDDWFAVGNKAGLAPVENQRPENETALAFVRFRKREDQR